MRTSLRALPNLFHLTPRAHYTPLLFTTPARTHLQSRKMSSETDGPLANRIREQLTAALSPPVEVELRNDSHKHAHHAAMADVHSSDKIESHFHLTVSSPSFDGLGKVQRHRLVYGLLKEELKSKADGGWGLHALQIVARGSDGK